MMSDEVDARTVATGELAALKRDFPPVKGKRAEIDPSDWLAYQSAKDSVEASQALLDACEISIRRQAGDASVLTVGGIKVAVRIVQRVTSASWVKDFYRRSPGRPVK